MKILICILAFIVGFGGTGVSYTYLKMQQEIKEIVVYQTEQNNSNDNSENNDDSGNDNNNEDNNHDGNHDNDGDNTVTDGELTFHFLELGNKYTGDCTYIKAGDIDILIDAGSKVSSIPTITSYINQHVTDNTLEYVIVTHAHEDHYAGFAGNSSTDSLFDIYTVEVIIDFAKTNQTTGVMYNNYISERNAEVEAGAKHYTALDCVNETNGASKTFDLGNDIDMTILNQKFYTEKASTENDYSVCTLFTHGERNFLFTGDLEEEGEESLASLNNLPHCVLYKAGHHGSKTSSHNVLLNEITPEIVCVCCCAGNYEYTKENANNFPTQDFINRIAPHTDKVYVTTLGLPVYDEEDEKYKNDSFTSMNGNIVVSSTSNEVKVECSNNNLKLKETDWFKANRTLPSEWQEAG